MQDKLNPLAVFICAFGVSSFAGLAALLRAGKEVNKITVLSAILNSGFLGLAIALLWYTKFQDNVYFLIGICVLAGLGGATMVDFVVESVKSGGLSIGGFSLSMKSKPDDKSLGEKKESTEKKDDTAK